MRGDRQKTGAWEFAGLQGAHAFFSIGFLGPRLPGVRIFRLGRGFDPGTTRNVLSNASFRTLVHFPAMALAFNGLSVVA